MKKVRVLGIGVATMDVYLDHGRMYPGGNEYNVACNAAFLGAEAGFLGVFANDVAGDILEKTLNTCGVNTAYSHHEHGSSGYSLVRLKPDGDRVFLDWNKQGVTDLYPISFSEEEMEYVKKYDVISIGRCSDVSLDKIQYLYENGVSICYDFHAIYSKHEIRQIAPYITYGFFSSGHLEEAEIKENLKLCHDFGAKIAIGTRGADSVIAYDGKKFYEQETYKVEPVDALGAGDSYIGGFLTNYLMMQDENMSQEEIIQTSLKNAARHSASVVLKEGSIGVGYDVDIDKLGEIINL